nr:MAG TPA: hypothetical protein [Caudoviricetes sp.]
MILDIMRLLDELIFKRAFNKRILFIFAWK